MKQETIERLRDALDIDGLFLEEIEIRTWDAKAILAVLEAAYDFAKAEHEWRWGDLPSGMLTQKRDALLALIDLGSTE